MKNLNNITIEHRTDKGDLLNIYLSKDEEPELGIQVVIEMYDNDEPVAVFLSKEELEQHIEICQLMLSKMKPD